LQFSSTKIVNKKPYARRGQGPFPAGMPGNGVPKVILRFCEHAAT